MTAVLPACPSLGFSLLNDWQRDFPLNREPYAVIAQALGVDQEQVLPGFRSLLGDAAISRIGGVWGAGAAGPAMLCSYAVAPERLESVAAIVSAHPGVNHNYEREHRYNLWFVINARDAQSLCDSVDELDAQTGCIALRLRMQRAYHIDLGFDLRQPLARRAAAPLRRIMSVAPADAALAALLEQGLPLLPRPYDEWAQRLDWSTERVQATLRRWQDQGTLRRYGVIVRHHEAGFSQNAMTVFDLPDETVDQCGERLAAQAGVTLAYRRERAPDWPYNLYCMVHGQDRDSVLRTIAAAVAQCRLAGRPRAVLFSRRRFKQTGARYFAPGLRRALHVA